MRVTARATESVTQSVTQKVKQSETQSVTQSEKGTSIFSQADPSSCPTTQLCCHLHFSLRYAHRIALSATTDMLGFVNMPKYSLHVHTVLLEQLKHFCAESTYTHTHCQLHNWKQFSTYRSLDRQLYNCRYLLASLTDSLD